MLTVTKPKKSDEPKRGDRTGRKTAPIQVERELAEMCAVIASHDGVYQWELIGPVIRQFLWTHYARVQKEIQDRIRRKKEEEQQAD